MPLRNKRHRDFDPNRSDSDDETYGTSASKALKSRSARPQQSHSSRKRQRRQYDGDDSNDDEIEESDLSGAMSDEDEIEDEEVEIGPSGRPKRKAAKKQTIIEESGSEESENDIVEAARPRTVEVKPSLVVTLRVQTPARTPAPRRNTRARSSSVTNSRPSSSHHPHSNTRRSSRIAHDDTEPIVALTTSGHHVDVLRAGTRSPPEMTRPTRGGKGVKKMPAASIVYEESEQSSSRTKEEPLEYRSEIAASREDLADTGDEDEENDDLILPPASAEVDEGPQDIVETDFDREVAVIPESDEGHDVDDDEDPISKPGRNLRRRESRRPDQESADEVRSRGLVRSKHQDLRSTLGKRKTRGSQRSGHQESSDFEPEAAEAGDEDVSDSEASTGSPRKGARPDDDDDSSPAGRGTKRRKPNPRSQRASDEHDSAEEVLEELEDLQPKRSRRAAREEIIYDTRPRRRQQNRPDYRILNPELAIPLEDDAEPATTPSRKGRAGGGWQRSLFSTYGPFGGAGGPAPVFGGPGGIGAAAGADSDSSDDENMQRPRVSGIGGTVGMTPTATFPPGMNLFPPAPGQVHGADPLQAASGTPANVGKIKDKSALADADPLGVDQNVDFDSVGGLQGHIDQLKEMVALPLLYPEVFQRFHVTPPRGVLFHGPPGTGKTLLARALANSVSSQGRKVTFYMRKGADALSKWVGEAERQLRLLFDEARKNQPSIIFFDEIDGLAPVRSSKQEQIHASIVSTLLALMDGMDGRGQVIVIGATNRPDSIDPALRRPGRFDREFYFPLPSTEARRAILDIHTKGWEPPLAPNFKDEIALLTKGYGGADLRALCTEAALNAVQRRYPQIYKSNEKLQIDPRTIFVTAKDFMISVKNMVPSSERSASSGAAPLPTQIEPLLRLPLADIENVVAQALPQKRRLTALQEAEYEDAEDDRGMKAERLQQEFERSRVFRPRLLIRGLPGMGQQYLAGALLNHFEGLYVQSFDLPTLLSDSTRSSEAAVVQLFTEVRRHKPAVIYIPNVDVWYRTVGQAVISTFLGLLRTLSPTDPVLLLGILECPENEVDPHMIKDLFGYSRGNQYSIQRPERIARHEYFSPITDYINASPTEFPEPADRRKRHLELLVPVPPEPPKEPPPLSKAELKAQKKRDRQLLNHLKQQIQPVMDQIKTKSKKFRTGVIEDAKIRYLFEEDDPALVSTDLPIEERGAVSPRPYEKAKDDHGEGGLLEVATGRFIYNMETVTIEKRLSNGYYKRPRDFAADIKKLAKDARAIGDQERIIKANELLTNVEVDMDDIGARNPGLIAELEGVYAREVKREKEMAEKAKQSAAAAGLTIDTIPSNVQPAGVADSSTDQSSGPVVFGQLTNGHAEHPITPTNHSQPSTITNGMSIALSNLSDLEGHSHSNGNSVPSRNEDLQFSNSDDNPSTDRQTQGTSSSSFGPSAQATGGGTSSIDHRRSIPGSLSQKSLITPLAEGSNLRDYVNYASTTSSEKRNTGSTADKNTQSTAEKPESGPDFGVFGEPAEANSQIPDTVPNTQGSQSSVRPNSNPSSSQGQANSQQERLSQVPAIPNFPRDRERSSINSLLNDMEPGPSRALTTVQPKHIIDHVYTSSFMDTVVDQTSGCSVEQLEQIYSAMMSEIWRTRGIWDRGKVAVGVHGVFADVMEDIHVCQVIGAGSMEFE